jgi:hypothetical protein
MMAYERLTVWKVAHEFAVAVYRATDSLPESELYGLSYALVFARDVDLLAKADYDRLEELRVRVGKLTWGLYSAIAKQTQKAPRQS